MILRAVITAIKTKERPHSQWDDILNCVLFNTLPLVICSLSLMILHVEVTVIKTKERPQTGMTSEILYFLCLLKPI